MGTPVSQDRQSLGILPTEASDTSSPPGDRSSAAPGASSCLAMVREFHRVYGCATDVDITTAPAELIDLRIDLIQEELGEYLAEVSPTGRGIVYTRDSTPRAARELTDLAYVTVGTAVAFGLNLPVVGEPQPSSVVGECGVACIALTLRRPNPLAETLSRLLETIRAYQLVLGFNPDLAFAEVHRANMSKLGDDGKPVVRPDGKILKGPFFAPPDMRVAILNVGNHG